MKKMILTLAAATSLFALAACNDASNTTASSSDKTATSESIDLNSLDLPQLSSEVAENEDLVELETTAGVIKIKLFPEIAPKAVENFMTHAKDGYYDGLTFHRIVEDFMIQGGDPNGDGTGGESIWGEGFGEEISNQLYHTRGALSMAKSSAPNSQGSQFFIVQNHADVSDGLAIQYYPQKIIDAYKDGGAPYLDGNYTVFGQVIEGMDVVDTIAKAETTGEANSSGEDSTPKDPVKINSIKILQEAK
jgi:peptidyl-prolyl cis-trans isomerase A (cyclophilin A)